MPQFRYSAIEPGGQVARGVMEAASEADVIARLRRDGRMPLRAEPATRRSLRDLLSLEIGRTRLSRQDVADFTRELAVMLGAGQDLDRALRFLVETARRPRTRVILDALRAAVRDGGSLASALARQASSFTPLYVGLVRAGEAGGTLAPTLERLAGLLERERSLTTTVQSAMVYPALLVLGAVGSIVLLLTEVLPQFVPLFAQNGAALPASTQFLIDAGAFVANDGAFMLLALAATWLLVRSALRQDGVRLWRDRALLRLPVAGSLARDIIAARFTRTLGTLLLNGVPLVGALVIVRDAIGNRAGVAAVERATLLARGGGGLAGPLGESGVFPARTVHLLRLGEETAQLGPMALRAADIHEERTRLGVQRLVALLVPAITIVMGAAVAGIVSSLLLAMLSLNDLAQ